MSGPTSDNPRLGVTLVAGAAVAWSTAGYFSQLVHVDLFPMLVWRNIFGGLFITGYLVLTRGRATALAFRSLGRLGWAAAVVNGVSMLCYLGALRHTSVTNVVVIYATAPFVAAALAFLLYRDRASRRTLETGVIALLGVTITVLGTQGATGLFGDLLAVLMTLGLAAFTVVARRHPDRSMIAASSASAWMGVLIALPFSATLRVSPVQLGQLALFGITSFGLGLVLFSIGARHLHAARTALIAALDTPLAPLWVWLAFGDRPTRSALVGGGVVLVAVVVNILSDSDPALV